MRTSKPNARFLSQSVHACLFVALLISTTLSKSPPLVLKHADFNQNTVVNGRLVTVLKGNIKFEYEKAIIKSQYTKWRRGEGKALFRDNVTIDHEEQFLSCDDLDFDRGKKIAVLTGDVDFYDHEKSIRITADKATYYLDTKYLRLQREPKLYRFDTTSTDTMIVLGKEITYDDSLSEATAITDVEIYKGKLSAFCQRAYFDTKSDMARLREEPELFFGIQQLDGDSVDLYFVDERLRGISVQGNARGDYKEPGENDTTITEIAGDSLFISISTDGSFDTVWVYENSDAKYYLAANPNEKNEASGKQMILSFAEDGVVDKLRIFGNARSTYYIEGDDGSGRNEASGDQIDVTFREGRAVYLKLVGSVRGMYFSEGSP